MEQNLKHPEACTLRNYPTTNKVLFDENNSITMNNLTLFDTLPCEYEENNFILLNVNNHNIASNVSPYILH